MRYKRETFFAAVLLGTFLIASLTLIFAQRRAQNLPQSNSSFISTTQTGQLLVRAKDNLQAAIDRAKPGDTILLEAGATFVGPITLRKKTGDAFITIQSSKHSELPEGKRVSPSQKHLMAKIVTPGKGQSAILTEEGAHHYKLIGLEVTQANSDAVSHELVSLGHGWLPQDKLSKVPYQFVIDRCYIHGDPISGVKRGVGLNSAHTEILNSYLSDCKLKGQDAQAVAGWNGPGPFKIINNYLEGSGENVLFGGSDSPITNLIPSDILIQRNHFYKPPSWKGVWTVKNLFELKNAQRVTIEGNIFENNWTDGQNGYAILFTIRNQDGGNPWAIIKDVVFRNNIVRNSEAGINILGEDYTHKSQELQNLEVSNNLLENIDGHFLMITGGIKVTFTNNTVFQGGNITTAYGKPTRGFTFTNNIVNHNQYGIIAESKSPGNQSIAAAFPDAILSHNILADMERTADYPYPYPEDNHFPSLEAVGFTDLKNRNYRLAPNSKFRKKGTNKKDFGCDIELLEEATKGIRQDVSDRK
jgi:hypothetical protein